MAWWFWLLIYVAGMFVFGVVAEVVMKVGSKTAHIEGSIDDDVYLFGLLLVIWPATLAGFAIAGAVFGVARLACMVGDRIADHLTPGGSCR